MMAVSALSDVELAALTARRLATCTCDDDWWKYHQSQRPIEQLAHRYGCQKAKAYRDVSGRQFHEAD